MNLLVALAQAAPVTWIERIIPPIAATIAAIVALGALAVALDQILRGLKKLAKWTRHRLWPWAKNAFRLVDALTDLPDRLGRLEAASVRKEKHLVRIDGRLDKFEKHVDDSEQASARWAVMEPQVLKLLVAAKNAAEATREEFRTNHGSTAKDQLDRIEAGITTKRPTRTRKATTPTDTTPEEAA